MSMTSSTTTVIQSSVVNFRDICAHKLFKSGVFSQQEVKGKQCLYPCLHRIVIDRRVSILLINLIQAYFLVMFSKVFSYLIMKSSLNVS